MQTYRPIVTKHRLRRDALWALAMLSWLAAVLFGALTPSLRQLAQRCDALSLRALTRLVRDLLIVRALHIAGRPPRRGRMHYWRRGRDLRRRHWVRSLLGARLRRRLKHNDLATHIAQLIPVLRNLDAYAARLARRLRRLHRLWRTVPPIAPAECVRMLAATTPALADTS